MRKLVVAAAIFAASVTTSAAASIVVVGSTPGRECYEAATNGDGTMKALAACDLALDGGLTASEVVATYVNRGVVKINAGKLDSAIEDFDRAIALDPSEPESYLNKGSALLRSETDVGKARALFSEALERNTRRPELAFVGRAIASELSGDIKSAYHDYRRAREAAPHWRLPREELSRFQVRRASSSM